MSEQMQTSFKSESVDAHEIAILEALLQKPEYVSGNTLAQLIGLSRTSVHSRIENLKKAHFKIEASPKKGYRLKQEPKAINAHLLRIYKKTLPPNFSIHFYPKLDSTNEEAERQFYQQLKPPFAIIAGKQTQGRGRLEESGRAKRIVIYIALYYLRRILPPKSFNNSPFGLALKCVRLCEITLKMTA